MNNNTKKWSILLGTLVLAAGITACGKSEDNSPAAAPSESNSPSVSPSASASPSSSPSASPTESSSPSASTESEPIEVTGEYVGLADPHTVEIKVEDGGVSYQLGDGMDKAVEELKTGDLVKFKYVEKTIEGTTDKQLVITEIEKQQ